ncbi:uncharacterized protein LOC112453779 isoform X1 [Temnothorax curvispinosus]|uniref:Uncharacterized protein LOC112453779 isoform X1 n=1 Tax=Temnothorax curvispinosus TaxID=300111 RepID=A0A6J1PMC0_9HYME|nr:uncharacterized protein LOC112453779 isoform X1 [Temnothorax curvispinosus]
MTRCMMKDITGSASMGLWRRALTTRRTCTTSGNLSRNRYFPGYYERIFTRWLCANPCFTWRCIITIIVRFTVLQFFGRRGWETDGQPRIPATRPGTSKSTETRKETCNQRVKRQNFLPPHILFVRVVTAHTTVSLRAFKVLGQQKFGALQEKYIDSCSESIIEFPMKESLCLHITLLCAFFCVQIVKFTIRLLS